MTHNANRRAETPWGQLPAPPAEPADWLGLLTLRSLLTHIVAMLCVTSLLTIVNLLIGPRVWWSLALLVVWLALVMIHAIGVGSRSVLFVDDDAPPTASRTSGTAIGPAVPGWLTMPKRGTEESASVPESWALPDDHGPPAWTAPTAPSGETAPVAEAVDDEKVPWRAATDIAWLRKPRPTTTDRDDPPTSRKASS